MPNISEPKLHRAFWKDIIVVTCSLYSLQENDIIDVSASPHISTGKLLDEEFSSYVPYFSIDNARYLYKQV
jgi:hypothetical protein